MATLNMRGPYTLNTETIDKTVTTKSPGNYALGKTDTKDDTFIVEYVGRADDDLIPRLKKHAAEAKYTEFKYSYAASVKDAFEKECRNYHAFGGSEKLGNKYHPDRPEGKKYPCPVCDIFD